MKPSIEIGGFDAVFAQQTGQHAPRLRHAHSGRERFNHRHGAPV